jgi:hypothetical protein
MNCDIPAGSGSLKSRIHVIHVIFEALNGLALLDKVLVTCSINDSSPNARALFVASRMV